MSARNYFKDQNGNTVIEVNDGTYFTDTFSPENANSEFYLEFYSDQEATNPVTPTSGTIKVYGSPMGAVYIADSTITTINAADVSVPDGAYTPPVLDGMLVKSKMILDGIAGANYCRAILFSY